MQTQQIIQIVKRVNICLIMQLLLVGLLLISEQFDAQINIVLGFFIPIYKHYLSLLKHSSSTKQNALQTLLSNSIQSNQFENNSTSSSLSPSQNSPSVRSPSKSFTGFDKKNSLHSNSQTSIQQQQLITQLPKLSHSFSEENYMNNDYSPRQRIQSCSKMCSSVSNQFQNSSFSKSQNYTCSNNKFSFQQTCQSTSICSGNSNSILSYWPMYCVLLIIEAQFISKTLIARHEYQILKCLLIFILRGNSFGIYLLLKEAFTMKGQEAISLFTTPQSIQLKNEIIMQKIDDQIKCYSRFNISLSKNQSLKNTFTQSYNSFRRSNS